MQPIKTTFQAATPVPASPKSNSSGKRRNRKACFVCKSVDHLIKDCDFHAKKMAKPAQMNYANRSYHKQYALKPLKHSIPSAVLTQSKPVSNTAVRLVSAVLPYIPMTRPRHANRVVTMSKSPIRRQLTRNPSSRTSISPPRVNVVQVLVISAALGKQGTWGNPQLALQDKGVINSGCSRHMTGNMSYLSDFEELNGGYVAFGGNPKGGKITGLPTKVFENDYTCVACKKGKQHKASCKTKLVSSVDQPLFRLHMDLFGPTFVKILNKKSYCLVITDDYSRFTWVFFLASKDETSPILKTFITGLENQISLIVKNGVAERKNRTLIEAARTMLADSLLPIPFWAEAVNTACYVQNRVLVTKPHNKTPYELLHGRSPSIGFMKPFGCPVTIVNTLDHLGKFQGKVDEGFLVGYSVCSNAFKVFNSRTRIIQETLHVNFLENKPNLAGTGPTWLFDIDSLLGTMNYHSVTAENQTNSGAGLEDIIYSDDEDIVGAEANFNNLEPTILVSPIPTTSIHKDHPISQIIGDLSSTTQTRSMTRA
nr:hypothetical protein [Tanacetum cinerariifolium]